MDKNLPGPMTPFDDLITSPELQIMKLLIPYAPASKRQMLAACVLSAYSAEGGGLSGHRRSEMKKIHPQSICSTVSAPI